MRIEDRIAQELNEPTVKVSAAMRLLDEGHTVPFIARYRKEATGQLDDAQLRTLEQRLKVLRALEAERSRVIDAIREQGKLTPELEQKLLDADTLSRVQDLWLPYRPKRQTRAQKAIEAGLEPLAEALLAHPSVQGSTVPDIETLFRRHVAKPLPNNGDRPSWMGSRVA